MPELMLGRERALSRVLRSGTGVSDSAFDRIYPQAIQSVSTRFWTPVAAALAAAEWIGALDCRSVLDVGAGVGKFCIVSSLVLGRQITGVEQREHLVALARAAAARYAADVDCIWGTLDAIDPGPFDCFYLFNPFAENVFDPGDRLDATVELSEERWFRELARVEGWLDFAPLGTAVVTYNGFGGRIPASFRLRRRALVGGSWLRVWTKHTPGRAHGFFVEIDQGVLSSEDLETLASRLAGSGQPECMHSLIQRPLGCQVGSWPALMPPV